MIRSKIFLIFVFAAAAWLSSPAHPAFCFVSVRSNLALTRQFDPVRFSSPIDFSQAKKSFTESVFPRLDGWLGAQEAFARAA